VLEDDVRHPLEVLVEEQHNFFRRELFGQAGEFAEVGEQHGDLAPLALELRGVVALQDAIQHRRGDVPRKAGLEPFALGQPGAHGVDGFAQIAEFVLGRQLGAGG